MTNFKEKGEKGKRSDRRRQNAEIKKTLCEGGSR